MDVIGLVIQQVTLTVILVTRRNKITFKEQSIGETAPLRAV